MTDMTETQKHQRRTVLVKKSLQLKYIAVILVSAVAVTLIASSDTFYTMYRITLLDNPSLAPLLHQIWSMLVVKLALFFGIVSMLALLFSHRLAGPIYRFEKSAQAVAGGDLTHRVSLRTGDELLDLQEEFNGMVASLQSAVQKDRTLIERLAQRLDLAKRNFLGDGSAANEARLREEIDSIKSELEHVTAAFKV